LLGKFFIAIADRRVSATSVGGRLRLSQSLIPGRVVAKPGKGSGGSVQYQFSLAGTAAAVFRIISARVSAV
jgi:hypothetical protein